MVQDRKPPLGAEVSPFHARVTHAFLMSNVSNEPDVTVFNKKSF